MRKFSTSVLLWYSPNSQSVACFSLHFQVYSVPSPPAALVLRFARLSPPQRHSTRRFSSPVLFAFSMSCVFWNALPGPLSAGVVCGASLALRALIPAPRAQDAGCRMGVVNVTVHLIWLRSSSSLRLTVTPYSIYIHAHPIIPVHVYWALHRQAQMEIPGRCSAVWYDPSLYFRSQFYAVEAQVESTFDLERFVLARYSPRDLTLR
jgi:hypothetical protein